MASSALVTFFMIGSTNARFLRGSGPNGFSLIVGRTLFLRRSGLVINRSLTLLQIVTLNCRLLLRLRSRGRCLLQLDEVVGRTRFFRSHQTARRHLRHR